MLDAGDRFERVELNGRAIALARESVTVLVANGRERTLVFLDKPQRGEQLLSDAALRVAQSSAPLLASAGNAVALAEFGRALLVSPNGGKTFRSVAGTGNATAVAGAELARSAQFFAAVYRETSDQSQILLVDPELGSAVCIATLDSSALHVDALDRSEWARISRLVWHAASLRLWAVGGFGVASILPTELA